MNIAIKTIAALSLVAGAAAGAHGFVQEAAKEGKEVERIVLKEVHEQHGKGERGKHGLRRGHSDTFVLSNCDGDKTEINEGDGKEKTHIVLCTTGVASGADRVKRLEELRSQLAKNEKLSAEHRARVDAAVARAIERARAGTR
ncbi:MAG TPA: hypothetical protein VNT25_03990 [Allosphingosinicella sp.]|nr:hypothetical protein [Allosphingosinicella sp.]